MLTFFLCISFVQPITTCKHFLSLLLFLRLLGETELPVSCITLSSSCSNSSLNSYCPDITNSSMCVTLAILQISEYLIKLSYPEIYTTPKDQKFRGKNLHGEEFRMFLIYSPSCSPSLFVFELEQ